MNHSWADTCSRLEVISKGLDRPPRKFSPEWVKWQRARQAYSGARTEIDCYYDPEFEELSAEEVSARLLEEQAEEWEESKEEYRRGVEGRRDFQQRERDRVESEYRDSKAEFETRHEQPTHRAVCSEIRADVKGDEKKNRNGRVSLSEIRFSCKDSRDQPAWRTYGFAPVVGLSKPLTRYIPIAFDSEVEKTGGMQPLKSGSHMKDKGSVPTDVKRRIRYEFEEAMRGLEDQEFLYGGQGKIHGRLKDGFAIMRGEYAEDLHETDMYAVEEGW